MQAYRPLLAIGLLLCGPAVLAADPSTDRQHPLDDNPTCMDRDGTFCVINDGPRKRVVVPAPGGAGAKPGGGAAATGAAPAAPAAPASTLRGSQ